MQNDNNNDLSNLGQEEINNLFNDVVEFPNGQRLLGAKKNNGELGKDWNNGWTYTPAC